jgi:hypothetical protein
MFIIIAGNPIDGVTCYGPFKTGESAGDWAEDNICNDDWWIANITEPGFSPEEY